MHRFFIPREWIERDRVLLKEDRAHQVVNVLRLKAKEHIVVLDNSGWEYEVAIEQAGGDLVRGKVLSKTICPGEPGIRISLYQALLKTDKFELVLQKGVELGVSTFIPFISERCAVRAPSESRMHRWQAIVREAAEQSGRALIPALKPPVTFREACEQAEKPAMLFWEEEPKNNLPTVLRNAPFRETQNLGIFIGPEGGFPPAEAAFASSCGILPVRLGQRVLRAETAGIAAISAILYEKGEMGYGEM